MSGTDDPAAEPGQFTAREHLAWLMWCYDQGYTDPADRAILTNWMGDNPATLTPGDKRAREGLLAMADEILAILAREHPHG